MITNKDLNDRIIKFLKRYGWILWLSISLRHNNILITDLSWWVLVIPLIILVLVSQNEKLKDGK